LPQDALDELALPHVSCRARVAGVQWRKEIYDLIGKFHDAKGFDPISQDVAIELGYPLLNVDRLNDLINGGKVHVPVLVIECKYN
jgi:hypothetical protein